mmetsp:Transcript_41294/g.119594  ORF Transcript_41294/g.119594 Transcript_41294/m.119594 type:complete len:244 (+) Transcript_41294:1436-2167(+)
MRDSKMSPSTGCNAQRQRMRRTASLAKMPSATLQRELTGIAVSGTRTSAMIGHFGCRGRAAKAMTVRMVFRSARRGWSSPARMTISFAENALTRRSSSHSKGEPWRMRIAFWTGLEGKWRLMSCRIWYSSASERMTMLTPAPRLSALEKSFSMTKRVFSVQPKITVWPLAMMRLRFLRKCSSVFLTTSTMRPKNNKLNRKPKKLKTTAAAFTLQDSLAPKPICVPGSKNMPHENHKLCHHVSS